MTRAAVFPLSALPPPARHRVQLPAVSPSPEADGEGGAYRTKKESARRIEEDYAEERRKARKRNRSDRDDESDDEDEYDRAARRRVTGGGRRRGGGWHKARVGVLVGGIVSLLFFGVLALLFLQSDNRRTYYRGIACAAAAVFSLVPIGRALAGTVYEDE